MVLDIGQFTMESIATEVTEMKLETSFFQLPAGAKTIKGQ